MCLLVDLLFSLGVSAADAQCGWVHRAGGRTGRVGARVGGTIT